MEIHPLLAHQLALAQFNCDQLPENLKSWQVFIANLNKTYHDSDQQQYLKKNSCAFSAHELEDINTKFETVQHIAGLGCWYYDRDTDNAIWSKELLSMFGIKTRKAPNYKQFFNMVHLDDRKKLSKKVNLSLVKNVDYQCKIRIKSPTGKYRWYCIIGHHNSHNKLSGVLIDINKNQKAESKIQELNNQLLTNAHRAGISEVATSILHNIKNILNSSNISIVIINENLNKNYYEKIFKITAMIHEHINDLHDYLTLDATGKLIPDYLIELIRLIKKDHEQTIIEANNVFNNLNQIKEIVDMQQSFSGVSGYVEKLFIPDVIDTALHIVNNGDTHFITFEKQYQLSPFTTTVKSKLLQILINLIKNAKESVLLTNTDLSKHITLGINKNKNTIDITVSDNGIGISKKNLNNIFTFGFTTKETGHGFGLHSSAIAAQNLGGELVAKSDGEGKGATFTLSLPLKIQSKPRIIG